MKTEITFLLFIFFISLSVNAQTRKWETITHSTDGCHNQIRVKLERRVRLYDENVYEVRATLSPSQTTFNVKVSIKGDKEGSWSRFVVPINGEKIYEFSGEYSKTDSPSFELKNRAYIGLELKHLIGKERYAKCGEHSNEIFLRDKGKGERISREKKKDRAIEENKIAVNSKTETNKQENTDSNSNSGSNQTSNNTNSESSTPQSRLKEYQNQADIANNKTRQQQEIDKAYQDDTQNAISESFDSEGNFNAGVLINSLPTATTKTQAYSNLIMSGTAILGQILQSRTTDKERRRQEIANRRIQLKDGIGKYDSENNKTGHWTYFYMNTTAPKSSGSYKNGKKNGIWEIYENQEYSWAMDKIMTEVVIYDNGNILKKFKAKNANYSITRETGLFSRKQNFIKQKGNYIIDTENNKIQYGLWEEYNDFGVNISTGYYNINGKQTGQWTFGYGLQKNGVWQSRTYHFYYKRLYPNPIPNEKIIYYHRNGKVLSETYLEDGQVLSSKKFDKSGKIVKQEKYEKRKKEIDFIELDINTFEKYAEVIKNHQNYLNTEKLLITDVNIDSTIFKIIHNFSELKNIGIYGSGGFIIDSVKRIRLNYFHNNITKIKNLESLSLRYSDISNLPSSIENLTKLKKIDMVYNELTQIPNSLCTISSLETIDFSNNQIKELPINFRKLSNLKNLSLFKNNLTTLPDGFGEFPKLKSLNLGANQLNELPENFGNMPKLKTLILVFNNLKTLPENFINMTELTLLMLDKNLKRGAKEILKKMKANNKNLVIEYR